MSCDDLVFTNLNHEDIELADAKMRVITHCKWKGLLEFISTRFAQKKDSIDYLAQLNNFNHVAGVLSNTETPEIIEE